MSNKDSAWKEAIETYFCDFVKLFFAEMAEDIDFDGNCYGPLKGDGDQR